VAVGSTLGPLIVGGVVVVQSADGNVYSLALSNGQVLGQANQGPLVATPNQTLSMDLGAGGGVVVVPAGDLLVAYR
jgi:hypothetical protein